MIRWKRGSRRMKTIRTLMTTGLPSLAMAMMLSCLAARAQPPGVPVRVPLSADDIYRVQALSDPQVSPDGQWVAYVVTMNDRAADEQRSAIWMVSWDGTQHLALTGAAA